jgi:hypothetical protein
LEVFLYLASKFDEIRNRAGSCWWVNFGW